MIIFLLNVSVGGVEWVGQKVKYKLGEWWEWCSRKKEEEKKKNVKAELVVWGIEKEDYKGENKKWENMLSCSEIELPDL